MPNVHLTRQMESYVRGQIESGAYANLSEVVRAGIRLLMERDGARQFYALKAELEEAVREAEAGEFEERAVQGWHDLGVERHSKLLAPLSFAGPRSRRP